MLRRHLYTTDGTDIERDGIPHAYVYRSDDDAADQAEARRIADILNQAESAQDHAQFIDRVAEMRKAQQRYFRTRDQNDLRISKDLERRVDAMIRELIAARSPALFTGDQA